jgi:hypothetical protein
MLIQPISRVKYAKKSYPPNVQPCQALRAYARPTSHNASQSSVLSFDVADADQEIVSPLQSGIFNPGFKFLAGSISPHLSSQSFPGVS